MIAKTLQFLLFFLYISNIQFAFLPDKIRTRLIVSVIGFFYYVLTFKFRDYYRVSRLLVLIMPLAIWMLFSISVNLFSQYWFLQYVILQMVFAVGAVFVIHAGKLNDFSKLLRMFLIYVLIQNTIAFVTFQIPSLSSLINSIQVPELSADRAEDLLRLRALGLGEFGLFGGGVWVAIGLLSLTLLYKMKKLKGVIYVSLFMYLLITGLFVARTSLTGLLSLILLFIPLKKNWYKALIWAGWGGVFLLLLQAVEQKLESQGFTTYYAFELFDKYRDTGRFQSNSYDITTEMWRTLPTDEKTWIIGDAKYEDERGGYYMHTDVGYLRVLFYGGLVGLFLYLFYIFKLAKLAYLRSGRDSNERLFLTIYYILVLIWMWKGHYDTNCVLYLCLFSATLNQKLLFQKLRLDI